MRYRAKMIAKFDHEFEASDDSTAVKYLLQMRDPVYAEAAFCTGRDGREVVWNTIERLTGIASGHCVGAADD